MSCPHHGPRKPKASAGRTLGKLLGRHPRYCARGHPEIARGVTTRMAQPTIRRWIAAIGSFGVYAVPLVGPHAAWFLGESLLQGFGSNPQIAWMVANVAVAIAVQVLAGVVLYWSLGGGWVRKMAWLGVVPLTAALNVAYMSAIP